MRKNSVRIAAAFAVALAATPAVAQDDAGWNPFRWVEDLGVEILHCDPQTGKSWTATQVMDAIRICRVEAEQAKAVTERETQAAAQAQEPSAAKRRSQ
jgi:hypothetical protein